MKTIFKFSVLLLLTMGLMTGCIKTTDPGTKDVVVVNGSKVFSATADGELKWILDGVVVANKVNSYTYVVDPANVGTHKLVIRETCINTMSCLPDSRKWTIEDGEIGQDLCDGVDNDGDGAIDEDFVSAATACGVGACAAVGATSCVDGAVVDSCVAGTASDEVCDGVDNDCNGTVDNGIPSTPTTCGVGECAATGAMACVNGAMVNTCKEGTPSAEVCDGKDNDCDGTADDIAPVASTCGIGACAATGEKTCVNGAIVDSCVAGAPGVLPSCLPNGYSTTLDADCNALADVTEKPICSEICNGLDDDNNGLVDDGIAPVATTCGVGECKKSGQKTCVNGEMVDNCVPGASVPEVCDGKDNDCDGTNDNGIAPVASTCGVGECAKTGQKTCVAGAIVDSCVAGTAVPEVCDGKDNDCDGTNDDGIAPVASTCGVGECARTGQKTCVAGAIVDSCVAGASAPEVCDGKDNDCDGANDNGIAPTPTTCGVGACAANGQMACVGGVMTNSCVAGTPGPAEACPGSVVDGIDNDCDGSTDEMGICLITCPKVTNVQATDRTLPSVQITWDACPNATSYKVYRAIYESDSAYELIAETTSNSYEVTYNWKTDVDDIIGPVPRMAPDATMAEKTTFGAELTAFRELALPYYMKFKAPSFFKVEACVGTDCSPASDPEPGQAKLIHAAPTGTELDGTYQHNSEVAELVIPSWGYPGLFTLSTVEPEVLALNWCGLDICSPSGGGYVLGRLRSDPVPIQVDVWYDTWKEVWAAHPNAYFIAEGYMGGEQQAASGAKGIVLLQGAFTMDIPGTHVDAYIWFYTGGASGHPNDGQMDITVDGVTYTYELPVQPAGWINTHGTPSIKLTKPVRPVLTQIGTPVAEWHMPFSEFDTNGADDDWDGVVDNPDELMLCPDGVSYSNPVCFSPEIP